MNCAKVYVLLYAPLVVYLAHFKTYNTLHEAGVFWCLNTLYIVMNLAQLNLVCSLIGWFASFSICHSHYKIHVAAQKIAKEAINIAKLLPVVQTHMTTFLADIKNKSLLGIQTDSTIACRHQ